MSEGISGKVIVITGASSGLGEASARRLSREGAKVVLGARRIDRLSALAAELVDAGGEAEAVGVDVCRRSEVEALTARAIDRFGRIDVLLNNAGLMPNSPLERLKTDDWDRMIDVNIKGVLYGVAAALPHMKRQKSGHIINVASVAGLKVRAGNAVYAATKSAVRVITEGLRQEVKPHNIRTTIISPGAFATELPQSISEDDIREAARNVFDFALDPDVFAGAIAYAIGQPNNVDINEIVMRPTTQEY